jgi:ribonuclease-3
MSTSEDNHLEDLSILQSKLGVAFNSTELLERALTHSSALGKAYRLDYERLEYLGDAVLDLAVADLLLDAHPMAKEGELSKMRAALVNTDALATFAENLSLYDFVRVSKAERQQKGHRRPSILADVVESIIGAIFKEHGYIKAKEVIKILIGDNITTGQHNDPKTELQEKLHALGLEHPQYILDQVSGPEHQPLFSSTVFMGSEPLGRGEGKTKKSSQQAAATQALILIEEKYPLRKK